jgi:transposase
MMGKMEDGRRSGVAARAFAAMLPHDHLLRRIDRLLDMAELREALAPHYSARGRPSVDPELLLRMALIGRLYAIPSERRLCEELRYNLAYRWFCRLRPDSAVPHHSTLSKARHGRLRIAGVFRLLFERTVQRCQSAGLIGGKDFVIDASFVAADASWQRKARCGEVSASSIAPARAIREWLQDSAGMPEPDAQAKGATAVLSRTDPAAAWSARTARGRFGYHQQRDIGSISITFHRPLR